MLNPMANDLFVLKRAEYNTLLSWNIVTSEISYEDAMQVITGYKTDKRYPLLCSSKFNSFDFQALSNNKFTLWRESEDNKYNIDQYDPGSLKWKRVKTFEHLQERIAFINHQLMNPNLIIVD